MGRPLLRHRRSSAARSKVRTRMSMDLCVFPPRVRRIFLAPPRMDQVKRRRMTRTWLHHSRAQSKKVRQRKSAALAPRIS
eukprot:scaffold2393_cov267-Pinguiococcus_pyrenoidosus.AAC.13